MAMLSACACVCVCAQCVVPCYHVSICLCRQVKLVVNKWGMKDWHSHICLRTAGVAGNINHRFIHTYVSSVVCVCVSVVVLHVTYCKVLMLHCTNALFHCFGHDLCVCVLVYCVLGYVPH